MLEEEAVPQGIAEDLRPYSFQDVSSVASLMHLSDELNPGERGKTEIRVAGRAMLIRRQGRLIFASLVDSTGHIQLFASASETDKFDSFSQLSIGDWIGVTGVVMKTKRGEFSVAVREWTMLAENLRSFGDKWRGISDPDLRYRQRYVDLWVNPGVRETFQVRSKVVASIRRYLDGLGFMEVETPMLQTIPTGAMAEPFVTHHNALDLDLYLRIAPELFLKRLVVGGFEKVFEIGRVFRNEGISPRHNPEFTMLELYQAYVDYNDIMVLTESLVSHVVSEILGSTVVPYGSELLDFTPPWRRDTLENLVSEKLGEQISLEMDLGRLEGLLKEYDVEAKPDWGPGKKVVELYEKTTESTLIQPTFVLDFPTEVSPLARQHRDKANRVERFEAFVAGRELANAFSELNDPKVQRERFEAQLAAREAGDAEAMVLDEDYLRSLEYGLPPTGGLGIGIDRLVMLLTNNQQIREVVLFPTMRPET